MTHLLKPTSQVTQFEPGSYAKVDLNSGSFEQCQYYNSVCTENKLLSTDSAIFNSIRDNLTEAVQKRIENTDRPIACLLSGGLDSSLITAIVSKLHGTENLHTWSIGMNGSEDLKYAQIVADYLGTQHHSIELETADFIGAIEEVIHDIESYDTTTVRASVGNWLISKYIKSGSDAKVIFNGDGSDEVTGGYMYFHCAPNEIEFDQECKRLLKDIHYFDVLRSDRSIASHGLEARTPFLDKNFVQSYLSIPVNIRFNSMKDSKIEKYLLRKAFEGHLPKEILWRTKEAFSDGVSAQKESWFKVIQKYAQKKYRDMDLDGPTSEKYLYKEIFDKYYPTCENTVPYMWMPRFVSASDSSARTLDIYKTLNAE